VAGHALRRAPLDVDAIDKSGGLVLGSVEHVDVIDRSSSEPDPNGFSVDVGDTSARSECMAPEHVDQVDTQVGRWIDYTSLNASKGWRHDRQ
jgi:hypothetical protein